jgi:4-hydroxybenzoate polyprenyltransferase
MQSTLAAERVHPVRPYLQLARVDHWFKNAFMLFGSFLALFFEPSLFRLGALATLAVAFLATCLVASSNYVLNEVLDAPFDRKHPVKKHRPAAAEKVRRSIALAEWLALGAAGIGLGCLVHPYFAASAFALWAMGIVYNVRPLRTKELPYLDVLSESVNNAIRLLLGWFALIQSQFPRLADRRLLDGPSSLPSGGSPSIAGSAREDRQALPPLLRLLRGSPAREPLLLIMGRSSPASSSFATASS